MKNLTTNVHECEVSMEQGSAEFEFRKFAKYVTARMRSLLDCALVF
jgi:hypothetical protein